MGELVTLSRCLVVISGPPLHGKTSVARALTERTNLWLVDPDAFRHLGFPRKDGLREKEEECAIMDFAYRTAVETAELNIQYGDPAVIAGPFSRDSFKAPLKAFWKRSHFVPIRIFRLELPEEGREQIILERIERRRSAGDPAVIDSVDRYLWARTLPTPWWDGAGVIDVDASQPLDAVCQQIMQCISDLRV